MTEFKHCHITPQYRYISLSDLEHKILTACFAFDGCTTTNTEIGIEAKAHVKSADIGGVMVRLRAAKLIDYFHIETGRHAAGSGRYVVSPLNDYFGLVLPGECEDLLWLHQREPMNTRAGVVPGVRRPMQRSIP